MIFFKETAKYKEILLLEFIENNDNISQPDIARHIGSSTSMVNSYIDDLEEKGFLKRFYKSSKVVKYNITTLGIKRKNYLEIVFIKELITMYLEGKEKVTHFLDKIIEKGFKDVIFYGAGDVAEIMLDIIKISEININVKCLIDDDELKQSTELNGIEICALSEVYKYKHDGIIITSHAYEEEIIKKLKSINYSTNKIVRYFEI